MVVCAVVSVLVCLIRVLGEMVLYAVVSDTVCYRVGEKEGNVDMNCI